MYFDFEDYRPDIQPVGRAISWREGVLLSVIVHMGAVILVLLLPRFFPYDAAAARAAALAVEQQRERQPAPRFVFVQPRVDPKAPAPPLRGEASDQDRQARTVERPKQPANPLPFSRGNTRERVEQMEREAARGQGPQPDPAAGQQARAEPPAETEAPSAAVEPPSLAESLSPLQLPSSRPPPPQARNGIGGRAPAGGGSLGEALRNLQRYVQRDQFDNTQGGGAFGPAIQFDTKGVEFGPWVRRFIAQVKRNWLVPYAAMSMKGHVVITFNVHKDGGITDLSVVGPSTIGAFNNAAYGALASSNPTAPLPPEYPADRAFFTVTFFYNEEPQ
ncbi:MAG: TonB family protein [Luteitalea sp.]|nr:TonB family protein [Luteitalea sp.]